MISEDVEFFTKSKSEIRLQTNLQVLRAASFISHAKLSHVEGIHKISFLDQYSFTYLVTP